MSHPMLPSEVTGHPSDELRAAFFQQAGPTWEQIAAIDWDREPLSEQGRSVAGTARNFLEFYALEHRDTAEAVERYLTRYSLAVHSAAH